MLPSGYVACCELKWRNPDAPQILYLNIEDSTPQFLSVYVTDANSLFAAKINTEELDSIASKLENSTTDVLNCLKQCLVDQNVTVDENQITFYVKHSGKEEQLNVTVEAVNSLEEKTKYLRTILFQLAKVTMETLQEKQTTPKEVFYMKKLYCEDSGMYLPKRTKVQPKRKLKGMSIVNPGSKKIHKLSGVQFEEEEET